MTYVTATAEEPEGTAATSGSRDSVLEEPKQTNLAYPTEIQGEGKRPELCLSRTFSFPECDSFSLSEVISSKQTGEMGASLRNLVAAQILAQQVWRCPSCLKEVLHLY